MDIVIPNIDGNVIQGGLEVVGTIYQESLPRKLSVRYGKIKPWSEIRIILKVLCLGLYLLRIDFDLGLLYIGVALWRSHLVVISAC